LLKIRADDIGVDTFASNDLVKKERIVGGVFLAKNDVKTFGKPLSGKIVCQLLFAMFKIAPRLPADGRR
jgi:hypothetical protein